MNRCNGISIHTVFFGAGIHRQRLSNYVDHLSVTNDAGQNKKASLPVQVMDTTKRPSMIERFLVDLVRHSELPK